MSDQGYAFQENTKYFPDRMPERPKVKRPGSIKECAGGLFPIEMYAAVNRVEGLSPGLYHYSVPQHGLCVLKRGDRGDALAEAALGQRMVAEGSVTLIWTAVMARTFAKYGARGLRYIYEDAGHVGQNAYLAATSLGLGCCAIGAYYDEAVDRITGVDGREETVIYMAAIGKPE
ncbi:SagB/ThcOx family dehydrogenase [Heliobacterium undosum]|uniref:SagB/ThcOx family dehydrogenase n=1 Tax=Heliomicrobium undosum TaxID=121734 RepID=A0A845L0X6_9FIRM|nr:SagB/ThcOx family dehydrogenase [Heliomicrobium undosum]MZP29246.1 SagB/ThcOx family dehydrogenase [Heliomicrobium undosum]